MPQSSTDTCIVIGNGPSLRGFDFHRLAGFTTLGMNVAYRHWDRIGWYPDYYACLDDQLIKTHHAEIERLYAQGLVKKVFVHGSFFEYHPHRLRHPDFTSFDQTAGYWYDQKAKALGLPRLYDKPAFKMSDSSKITTGSHAVRYAANLGHDRIVLLGIDLRYVEILPEAQATSEIGLVIKTTPKHNPNYFFDGYQQAGDFYNIPNPAVHDGNLHPRSFEIIPRDFVTNGVPCTIYNANRQSILSDKDIFPYVPIEAVLGETTLGSVMVPCNKGEIDAILANLNLWNRVEFSPAESETMANKPALVFVFNNASARPEQERIAAAFHANGMARFFSGICFEYLDLEGDRDIYIRDYTKPVGDQGYKAGPNNQFFSAIRRIAKYGRYTFLMETDCLPIRRGWLTRLQELVDASEPFWIMGSAYRGQQKLSKDFVRHLNGNAVYAAGDPEFQKFVTEFWEHHTWRLVRDKDKRLAYDCILEIMFSQDHIREQAVMDTWKRTAHFFRYFDYLQNISGNMDIANSNETIISELRVSSPETYILHNRTVHSIFLAKVEEGKLTPSLREGSLMGHPRILMIDMTAAGNGTATGEIKSNLLANWPKAAFMQIARHGTDGLAVVRREGTRFVATGIPSGQGPDQVAQTAREAIDSFAPDLVLYRPVPETEALHRFAMNEINRLKKPLVTWIMDDWPARMEAEAPDAWSKMKPDLEYLLQHSALRLSISEAMSEAFVRRYGVPFVPFANAVDSAEWPATEKRSGKDGIFRIRFAGGLAPDMNRASILQIAEAVERIAQSGIRISFQINTQQWWLDQTSELFKKFRHTQILAAKLTPREYRNWISEADSVVIAYNFDDASQRYVRYSMANKMPECLASGAALFAYGPRGVATIDYLETTGAAIVVSDSSINALETALRKLIAEPELAANYTRAARALAFDKHNLLTTRQRFTTQLRNAISKDPNGGSYQKAPLLKTVLPGHSRNEELLLHVASEFLLNPLIIQQKLQNDQAFRQMVDAAVSDKSVDPTLCRHVNACQKYAQSHRKN